MRCGVAGLTASAKANNGNVASGWIGGQELQGLGKNTFLIVISHWNGRTDVRRSVIIGDAGCAMNRGAMRQNAEMAIFI